MGICSSCLGRQPSDSEQSDSSHLLGDAYHQQYGSIAATSSHNLPQPDPEEIRRQRDALERICAQTSDKLIDVSQTTHALDGSKTAEYHRLFSERFPPLPSNSRPSSADAHENEDESTWLNEVVSNTKDVEGSWGRVEPIDTGALTIQFGDAFAADRKPVR
ncbi:hypothetical protein BU24DRAFT_357838 [Aaosphaeria arxii CBS 175.79]|uniref:Late endosomal/lysosomal adaptor and MAPK and MTOR activator-domain-containing protein n=1 Tax=Aaosphaeria arxii CBS 175.79 TaxID=1450172 RepID=A0A6A5X9H1_9PLEO|nr:uncharacterized protein BU24DRAFT_357838 [Aaosphaeria arxii CBS 175.79]KAF2009601.1 hypothetical protein BU24DRAFT_357838 [Aaosphaeria arxii CBS 175.79]